MNCPQITQMNADFLKGVTANNSVIPSEVEESCNMTAGDATGSLDFARDDMENAILFLFPKNLRKSAHSADVHA